MGKQRRGRDPGARVRQRFARFEGTGSRVKTTRARNPLAAGPGPHSSGVTRVVSKVTKSSPSFKQDELSRRQLRHLLQRSTGLIHVAAVLQNQRNLARLVA